MYGLETKYVAAPQSKKVEVFKKYMRENQEFFEFVNDSFEKEIWNRLQTVF